MRVPISRREATVWVCLATLWAAAAVTSVIRTIASWADTPWHELLRPNTRLLVAAMILLGIYRHRRKQREVLAPVIEEGTRPDGPRAGPVREAEIVQDVPLLPRNPRARN